MRRRPFLLLIPTVLLPLSLFAAPTAILVDTSRSIPPAQFEQAKQLLQAELPEFLAKGPVAIYAFNDAPVQVVGYSTDAAELQAGIQRLEQGGRFTLLYDCAFSAVKDMEARKSEGVLILVTDGKDENSAVTLEDAAARANAARVAIVTAGLGAAEEKVLRRLAALTGGRYAGPLPQAGQAGLERAWQESSAALVPVKPPEAPRPVQAAPLPPPPPPQAPAVRWWLVILLLVLGLGLLAALGIGVAILLKRTKVEERTCEKCGRSLKVWETECPDCLASKLAITHPGAEAQTPAAPAIPELDPQVLQKAPSADTLEHTLVLDEVPVLVLKRGNNPPRLFQLPPDQVVSVGRDKVNTLSVADQTLSGQHFRIVPKGTAFYLVDLQSTNGTYLDGERITLKELRPGSVIHAGQCDFTFRMEQKRLN
jgi:hypothetical protein